MTLLQGNEKGIPISDSAQDILTREHMLEGYEKQADDIFKRRSDRQYIQCISESTAVDQRQSLTEF